MSIFAERSARLDRQRRFSRSKPGVVVEPLEGRKLLSQMDAMPHHAGHHGVEVGHAPATPRHEAHHSAEAHHSPATPRHEVHHSPGISRLDHHAPGENQGGEVKKEPRYFEIFDNIGKRPDLNAVRAKVELDEDRGMLVFEGEMQGKINTTPADASQNSLYVFGVNRGSPKVIAPFALRPGVKFDSVVVVSINNATGLSATVVDVTTGKRTSLSNDQIHIEGRKVSVEVDPSLLPTPAGGVPLASYTFNLWPRESGGPDKTIASFIPENSMAPISVEGHHHDD